MRYCSGAQHHSNPTYKIENSGNCNEYSGTQYHNDSIYKIKNDKDCKKYLDIWYYSNPIYRIEKDNKALVDNCYLFLSSFNNSRISITI